jgi:hypothetical protein
MQFKKVARLSGLSLLVASIVVPAGSSVNQNAATKGTKQMADGMPLPPLPPSGKGSSLMADGMPLPPLPPSGKGTLLVADGMPLPPLPPSGRGSLLIADGMPLPPLPPSKVDVTGQVA